jgi:hypothetical protein
VLLGQKRKEFETIPLGGQAKELGIDPSWGLDETINVHRAGMSLIPSLHSHSSAEILMPSSGGPLGLRILADAFQSLNPLVTLSSNSFQPSVS